MGDWNAKVGSQGTPGVTGKFGLGVQNEAGQRLAEFCQEIMVQDPLMCCWILFGRILLKIFLFMYISDIGLWFSFFVCVISLSSFGIGVMITPYN